MRKKFFGIACLAVLLTIWGGYSVASADVAINATNFPDDNFREYVSRYCDGNDDGVLSDKEIAKVTWIFLGWYGVFNVSSLQGIEYFTNLKELNCGGQLLTTLDVSKNTKLTELSCYSNQLTELDLSKNTKLTELYCSYNQLTTLDLTKNTRLTSLNCENNRLTVLDVNKSAPLSGWDVSCRWQMPAFLPINITDSNNASYPFQLDLRDYMSSKQIAKVSADVIGDLNYFNSGYFNSNGGNSNPIPTKYSTRIARFASKPASVKYTYIVAPATASRDAITMDVVITTPIADVAVNATNFPDETFREYVSNNFDKNNDGVLNHDEIVSASWINVENLRISSLQGIEYLVNVKGLSCNGNRLTELDVSNNNALKNLYCADNRLTELKVGKYTALEKLECYNNRLVSLDVSYNPNFKELNCDGNRLASLNLTKDTALANLHCQVNQLTSLDVSKCADLKELDCSDNQLKELNLSKKTNLRKVDCKNNQLTKLNLAKDIELEELDCYENQLTSLNVRDCPELTRLHCSNNQLTELDVSQNPELSYLNCSENHLAVLDVSHNEYLTGLDCWSQTISPLFVISNGNGYYPYKFKLVNYMTSEQVANVSGLEVYDYNWNWIATMIQDGVVYCTSFPSIVRYNYAVGYNSTNMNVTLSDATYIAPPEIPGTFANGKLSAKYSSFVTISGDTAPYTCEMTSGTLPKGLKLKFSKTKITLYGTPKESGEFTFMIQITDANVATTTQTFALKITRPDITGTLSNGTVNGEYSGTLTASGGTNPYTWEISSGTLPDGLKLTYSDDVATISGKPTKVGSYKFSVRATDANSAVKTKSYTVKITQPTIKGTFAKGKLKAPYSESVTVSGGIEAYKWTVSSGALPAGLELTYSGTKATISGTPTKSGTFKFALKVTDANKATATQSFTLKITRPSISGTLANGTVKTNYTGTLKVSGGTETYTWVRASGKLPTGLKLTSSNTTATISGTPTKAGTFKFKLKVTDANGATGTKSFTVTIGKASSSSKESTNQSDSNSKSEKNQTKSPDEKQNSLPENSPETLEPLDGEDTDVSLYAELKVVSEDIVEAYDGKDSDMVKVKAGEPLRFDIGDWGTEVDNVIVYVDDKALSNVQVSDQGEFTLPAEVVHDDFKVGVKAKSVSGKELESEELYIIAE